MKFHRIDNYLSCSGYSFFPLNGQNPLMPYSQHPTNTVKVSASSALRGDVAVKGGITPVIKTAHLAEAFRINYEVHHGGISLNNWVNLHVILSFKNTTYFEVLLPSGAQMYRIIDDLEPDQNGLLSAPTEPGLGPNIDFDLIKSKTTEVLTQFNNEE